MASKTAISRREFLKVAGVTSGTALVTLSGLEALAPSAYAQVATEKKTVSVWLDQYHPTEWTTRSAENPTVNNAARILAEQFQNEYTASEVTIDFIDYQVSGESDAFAAWLTARIEGDDAPDLIWSVHNIPVQNGWALPIGSYLNQPNPYVEGNAKWRDLFYPSLMRSLVWEDRNEYCAPLRAIWPYLEVGLAYNQGLLDQHGLRAPRTWTEQKEVSAALKELGGGLSPWPDEGESGNLWPFALQILPPMMQEVCKEMDLNGDKFVGAEEALPAYRKGIIAMDGPLYRRAWQEMRELAQSWVDGFNTADLDLLWRRGELGLQYRATWEWANLANDPSIEFEQKFVPAPMPNSSDIPIVDGIGAYDPPKLTAGDGSVPGEQIEAIQGPDLVMLRDSVETRNTLDATLAFWQYLTTPENNAFLVNENQQFIPSVKDASLGPLWQEVANFQLPIYDYTIAWWGMGLFWDAQHFQNWRKLFVGWMVGDLSEQEFFARQVRESDEGAARYEATLQRDN
jgi:raffinose/stachyose/melibiose transport system substrate-binding protein